MCTISVDVIRIPTKGPGDVSGLMQKPEGAWTHAVYDAMR